MAEPGIKGTVFAGIVEQARALRDAGKVGADELERRLGPEGLALLEAKIQPASWYPVQVYGRIRELLRDVEGGGRDQYTIDAGAASARRMIESGIYQQLDYLKRWKEWRPSGEPGADRGARLRQFRQQVRLIGTVYDSMYNFGSSKIEPDPDFADRLRIEYWDAGVMPTVCRLAVLGFWNEIARHWRGSGGHGDGDLWTKDDFVDHYVIRMTRGVAEI